MISQATDLQDAQDLTISPMGVYDQIPLRSDASFADTPPAPASLKTSVGFCEVYR